MKADNIEWVQTSEAARILRMDVGLFKRMLGSPTNPPPYVMPSPKTRRFNVQALKDWQRSWAE